MGDDRFPDSNRGDTGDDRKRLDELDVRLRAARKGPERPAGGSAQRQASIAYRVLIEMMVGLGVGGVGGWWLDRWLGTSPFLLAACLLTGFAAGALNAYRAIRGYTASVTGAKDD